MPAQSAQITRSYKRIYAGRDERVAGSVRSRSKIPSHLGRHRHQAVTASVTCVEVRQFCSIINHVYFVTAASPKQTTGPSRTICEIQVCIRTVVAKEGGGGTYNTAGGFLTTGGRTTNVERCARANQESIWKGKKVVIAKGARRGRLMTFCRTGSKRLMQQWKVSG